MKLRASLTRGLAVSGLFALVVGQASPAAAVSFLYSQSAGWDLESEPPAMTEGPGAVVPGRPATASSGIEFFEPAVNPNPALHLGDNAPPANTYTTIGWGCTLSGDSCAAEGNNEVFVDPAENLARSALYIEGRAGVLSDDGEWVVISHLEHTNREITGQPLGSVTVSAILRLATTPEPTTDGQSIFITFEETLNREPCVFPSPNGSVCDDFFQFDFTSFEPLEIEHEGQTYMIEFRLADLTDAMFDEATGTIFTAEGVRSSVNVEMRITPVPEPATLMLLGAGLIGVGFAAAKRRRSKM